MMKTNRYMPSIAKRFKMNKLINALMICAALMTLSACNVEEFPHPVGSEEPVDATFSLNLVFETTLPVYTEIEFTRDDSYDLRYQINAYRQQDNGKYDYSQPSATFTYFNSELDKLNQKYEVTLPTGTYQFVAFTDYVDASGHADVFYNTANFADIVVNTKPYSGNNDYRDCFNGSVEAEVSENGEATVNMTRPLGKYIVIATDAEDFYTRVIEQLSQRGEYTPSSSAANPVNLDNYTVTVYYQQYMPSEFNLFSNRPIDSALGVAYSGKMSTLNPTELQMAFDYVFVNENETFVNIVLQVTDNTTDEVISTTPSIKVPLMRSKLTIVRGQFLTSQSNPGMSIDPDFDGEYNIEIK